MRRPAPSHPAASLAAGAKTRAVQACINAPNQTKLCINRKKESLAILNLCNMKLGVVIEPAGEYGFTKAGVGLKCRLVLSIKNCSTSTMLIDGVEQRLDTALITYSNYNCSETATANLPK